MPPNSSQDYWATADLEKRTHAKNPTPALMIKDTSGGEGTVEYIVRPPRKVEVGREVFGKFVKMIYEESKRTLKGRLRGR